MSYEKKVELAVITTFVIALMVTFHIIGVNMSERACFADPSTAGCDAYLEDAK